MALDGPGRPGEDGDVILDVIPGGGNERGRLLGALPAVARRGGVWRGRHMCEYTPFAWRVIQGMFAAGCVGGLTWTGIAWTRGNQTQVIYGLFTTIMSGIFGCLSVVSARAEQNELAGGV